ncbi:ribbon-helix-helix domain-containing protein [Leptolyngbya sp. FACHB-671]|uniref:ribbon-helix-helix domain-containing protein n=1 Tax=Leptolyngbya sp. FACHB-671 TaxID=2692812 RepID=UPI0018EF51DB
MKRPRIAKKPTTPPPEADTWVEKGGLDPEIEPEPETETAPEPEPKPALLAEKTEKGDRIELAQKQKTKGKSAGGAFPHRISFDVDTLQYKRLKRAAFEEDRPMNEIIREAVEEWLNKRNY